MSRLADYLTIGQHWRRRRDRVEVRIRQVHRADRCVEVDIVTPQLLPSVPPTIKFSELADQRWYPVERAS